MWQDLRYSFRALLKRPGFLTVASVVLALGIGLNTALFSIVYAVFFRPLPVYEPQELVYLYWIIGAKSRRPTVMPVRDYELIRQDNEAFVDVTGHWGIPARLTIDGETDSTWGEIVFANYFDVLGLKPQLGRFFTSDEDHLGSTEPAIVISDALWKRRFKGDRAVVGTKLRFATWSAPARDFTIIGVAGPGFRGVSDPWTPSDYWATLAQVRGAEYDRSSIAPIARLKPGVSLTQARALLEIQGEQIRKTQRYRENAEYVAFAANDIRMPFWPEASVVPARLASAMMAVVGIVLLVAVINIAGLQTARAIGRANEIAVRLVIGAGPWRVARQLLTESTLIAALGGVLGLLLASWLLAIFVAYTPRSFAVDIWFDWRVVTFTMVLITTVGMACGMSSAWRARNFDLLANLPGQTSGTSRRIRSQLYRWILMPQVALSLVLLWMADIQVRALAQIELARPGYNTSNLLVMNYAGGAPESSRRNEGPGEVARRAEQSREFYRQLLSRLDVIGGASGIALTTALPVSLGNTTAYGAISQEDQAAGRTLRLQTLKASVSPGYFRTMEMTIVKGRDFDERDSMTSPKVAVISESLARRLWPGRDPLGRFVAAANNFPAAGEKFEWLEVVGVVNEVDPILRDAGSAPFVYQPLSQEWMMTAGTLVARFKGDGRETAALLKNAVNSADPLAEVYRTRTLEQIVGEILYPRRLAAGLLAVSGLIALVLSSVGLYGLVSYTLAQRVRELGVRCALGASRQQLVRMVIGEGIRLALVSLAAGVPLCFVAWRVSARLLGKPPAVDIGTMAAAPLVLLAVILLACYFPARRAARVDPLEALRSL